MKYGYVVLVLLGLLGSWAFPPPKVAAESRFVIWQSNRPLSPGWRIDVENANLGTVSTNTDAAPTVVIINFTSAGCWKLRLYDGSLLAGWWEDSEQCRHLWLPLIPHGEGGDTALTPARPPPPTDIVADWTSVTAAELRWLQHSDADVVCVSKDVGERFIFIDCLPGDPGWQTLPLPPAYPADWRYWPAQEDRYAISEYRGQVTYGVYEHFTLSYWYWVPLFY